MVLTAGLVVAVRIDLYIWVPVAVFLTLGIVRKLIKAPTRPSIIMAERNYLKPLLVQATGLYATSQAADGFNQQTINWTKLVWQKTRPTDL